jgi:hypothetical protein
MNDALPLNKFGKASVGTLNPPARSGLKALRIIAILPVALLLCACDDLACDSGDVLQTTKELVIQRIHNSGFTDSFDITIDNIRVQAESSKQLSCKANAKVTNSKMLAAMGAATFTYDVDYRVEPTTDGNYYVTVYPLHMLQN